MWDVNIMSQVTQYPKPKTYRNKKYLDEIRKRPCCVYGKAEVIVHHVSVGDAGFGMKSGDLTTVSLCRLHHDLVHHDPSVCRMDIYEELVINLRNFIMGYLA